MEEPPRRRRRVRHTPDPAGSQPDLPDSDVGVAAAEVADEPVAWGGEVGDTGPVERGLRGLVGGGSSQVRPAAAMRARDAARPRQQDLDRAEAELAIVRRHWVPRD